MIYDVGDLFRRKLDLDRLQHRAHHRDRKEGFKKSVAVPVENANGLPGTHPDRCADARRPMRFSILGCRPAAA